MRKSIEYKGYLVAGVAEPWSGLLLVGGYVITAARTGKQIRNYPEAVLRDSLDEACNAAIIAGLQYVDLMLPEIA